MPRPRNQQISISDTPYYHCMSRCVRRAFLCGQDGTKHYEHRRDFIEQRMRILSSVFAIDICSYAIMHNHYHLVVKINSSKDWSDETVIRHWLTLHKGPLLVQRHAAGEALLNAELKTVQEITQVWRERLQDLSWFMKCLNEPIARQANREDRCSGHFWESRFVSQALLTEDALLSCMAYVDLNPIRAQLSETPEDSEHTSIKERINPIFNLAEAIKGQALPNPFQIPLQPLASFDGNTSHNLQKGIPFGFKDYLELVDWTGRAVRDYKRGSIPSHLPPILNRLGMTTREWLVNAQRFEQLYRQRFRRKLSA